MNNFFLDNKPFCKVVFGASSLNDLKELLRMGRPIETLRLSILSEEIVACLIEAKPTIRTLVLDSAIASIPLLKERISTLDIEEIKMCSAHTCCSKKAEKDKKKEKEDKKPHRDKEQPHPKEKEGKLKFKGIDFSQEEARSELLEELKEGTSRSLKFKECVLPEDLLLWLVNEFGHGSLTHLDKISIDKDPEASAFLSERELPDGIEFHPKKGDDFDLIKEPAE